MNEDLEVIEETSLKIRTKEDAQGVIDELISKQNKIIDEAPKLSLEIKYHQNT